MLLSKEQILSILNSCKDLDTAKKAIADVTPLEKISWGGTGESLISEECFNRLIDSIENSQDFCSPPTFYEINDCELLHGIPSLVDVLADSNIPESFSYVILEIFRRYVLLTEGSHTQNDTQTKTTKLCDTCNYNKDCTFDPEDCEE